MKFFNDVMASAKACGLSERHFRRISEALRIVPMSFRAKHMPNGGRAVSFKWNPDQIAQVKEVAMKNKKKKPTKGY